MSRLGDAAAQTLVRRRLLANGYTPLANKDKMCVLPGWSHMHVDDALVAKWSNELAWRATGVRVERGLAVIDLDVNDADAVSSIVDAIPAEIWSIMQDAPVRRGKGAKEAWFVRLEDGEEPFNRLASAGFRHPDDAETVHRVEIFAGDSNRQFGVYGAHTVGGDGEVKVVYQWDDDRGLMQVPFDELPRVTRAQLATVAEIASRTLEALGWEADLLSKPGFSSGQPIYDLDAQEFETRDHGAVDMRGLEDLCGLHGEVRLSASWLEGDAAVNTTRCIASIHPRDGRLSILETASFEIHRPKDLALKPVSMSAMERMQELAARGSVFASSVAAAAPSAAEVGAVMADDMSVVVDALLAEYAYMPSEQRCVVPLSTGVSGAMSVGNFRMLMQPHAVTVRGPRGGEQVINPATLWASDARRVDVAGYRFRPDVTSNVATVDGQLYVNTYRAPEDVALGAADAAAAVAAFEALLRHLLPVDAERDWLRMWLAAKVQRPWSINCGVLLVAEIQGTGRGTLFSMVRAALGDRNVSPVSSVELMGGGGQAQYNEWLADSLMVTCDEVIAGDDGGGAMAWKRRESYERLKTYVDPQRRAVPIRRKGISNYAAEVFASFLLATNHINALPITADDRRFAVLMQERVRFIDRVGLADQVNAWRPDGFFGPAFGTALRHHLRGVAVAWDDVREAPNLGEGRLVMQQQNEGDVVDILRDVLSRVPGDFITNDDLRRRMQLAVTASGEGDHLKNWWRRTQDVLRAESGLGWRQMVTRQTFVGADGRQKLATVYYRDADGVRASWMNTSQADRYTALLAAAADVNRMLSAIEQAARDGRLRTVQ